MRITSNFVNTCEVLSTFLFKHIQWGGTEMNGPWPSTARLVGEAGGEGRRRSRGTRSSVRYCTDVTILNLPTPQGRCLHFTRSSSDSERISHLFKLTQLKMAKLRQIRVHLTLGAKTEAPATRKTTACIFSAAYLESPDQAQRCGTDASRKHREVCTWERRQSEPFPPGKAQGGEFHD